VSAFDDAQFIGGDVSDRRRAEITEALSRRR